MKIRSDFVTNSSSSSFILGFKNKDTRATELNADINNLGYDKLDENILKLLHDVNNAKSLLIQHVIMSYKEDIRADVQRYINDNNNPYERYSDGWFDYCRTSEFNDLCNNKIYESVANFKKVIEENDYKDFVLLTYSDHDNDELEHQICPHLKNIIATISHH